MFPIPISVIVPTLDEERALPATLDAVLDQAAGHEVIVVDGGSADGTVAVVQTAMAAHPNLRLLRAERGRARQMNTAVESAVGEWLLFLHADTLLPENALVIIASQPESVQAGCFRHRFSGPGMMLRVLSWFHNRRFLVTRVAYGDQALFIRHALFDELGRFADRPMEDIALGLRLRTATRPVLLPEVVTTDSRKFEQMGRWPALVRAISLLVRFRHGADVSSDPFFRNFR